jgi:hypothetical protein
MHAWKCSLSGSGSFHQQTKKVKKDFFKPYQNVMDPQHCCLASALPEKIVEGGSEEKPREDWEEKMVR